MQLTDFDFDLPSHLVAQKPLVPRDSSKLLLIKNNKIFENKFYELPDLLNEKDLIIFNDTKVIPSRLIGKRSTKSIEITLHKKIDNWSWLCFIKPAKKIKLGDLLSFGDLKGEVKEKLDGGEIKVYFNLNNKDLYLYLDKFGQIPLPPYIKRKSDLFSDDKSDYQTLFAKKLGAVASPTAGLHFTNRIRDNLLNKGIEIETVTLHVGAGTFLPVKTENIDNHKMHKEWGSISEEVVEKIKFCKSNGGKVLCVGTTTLRILETSTKLNNGILKPFKGFTDIFIKPGYKFSVPDLLLTNFHLPKSTLLMLVYAFGGVENVKRAYKYAILNNFRFFSYGDCCLMSKFND